jgi:hypothetical protein
MLYMCTSTIPQHAPNVARISRQSTADDRWGIHFAKNCIARNIAMTRRGTNAKNYFVNQPSLASSAESLLAQGTENKVNLRKGNSVPIDAGQMRSKTQSRVY